MTNDQRRAEEMKLVPVDPPEAMWGGLARQIVMWCRFGQPTGKALFQHLKSGGYEIPAWLREEVDDIDHVPPKGTVAVCIYRAMLDASPLPDGGGDRTGAGVEIRDLRDVLERFRDFVIRYATQWDISNGPCNHHNPIWQEVAEALSQEGQAGGSEKGTPSDPSHPPGQAVSQSIAGEDDLRAEIQSAFEAWGYPAYSTVMEGFEAGYRAALARSPAAGTGQECVNCGSQDSIETIRAKGYLSCCPERSMKPVAALAPAPSPQVERAWLTRTKLEEVARAIKTALEQRGHVQFSKGAEYGHVTDGGINTIVEILGRFETIPSPAPAQKG